MLLYNICEGHINTRQTTWHSMSHCSPSTFNAMNEKLIPRGLNLSRVLVKLKIMSMDKAEVVPEDVETTPNQGTEIAIVYTVVDSINQCNALPKFKSTTSVTNSITFRICATIVTNAPSPDPTTIPNFMISHKTMLREEKVVSKVQENGQFDDKDGSYSGGYHRSK